MLTRQPLLTKTLFLDDVFRLIMLRDCTEKRYNINVKYNIYTIIHLPIPKIYVWC